MGINIGVFTVVLLIISIDNYIKYLDFLCPIKTTEVFEAVGWLADLPQRTWPQSAGRSSDIILLKSTATILAAAMFVGDRTTASPSLAVIISDYCCDVKVRMLLRELEEARGTVVRMPQDDDAMDVTSSSGVITSQLVTFK